MTFGKWHFVNDIWSMTFGQWHLVNDIWSMTFGQWHLVNDIWSMIFSQWHFVNDILSMTFCPWHFVHDILSMTFFNDNVTVTFGQWECKNDNLDGIFSLKFSQWQCNNVMAFSEWNVVSDIVKMPFRRHFVNHIHAKTFWQWSFV